MSELEPTDSNKTRGTQTIGLFGRIQRKLQYATLLWVYLPFLRLRYTIERRQLRSVRKVRIRALVVLMYELRLRKYPTLLPTDDETVDDMLFVAAAELCDQGTPSDVDAAFIASHRSELDTLIQLANEIPACKALRVTYYELQILTTALIAQAAIHPTPYVAALEKLGVQRAPISVKDLYKIDKGLVRRIRSIRDEIESARAIRFDIPLDVWGPALSIGSTLFLVSGYLYNAYVLGSFGIQVNHYFGLTDYVAASIENIRFAAFATIGPLIGALSGSVRLSRMSSSELRRETRINTPFYYIFAATFAFGAAFFFIADREHFFDAALILSIILAIEVSPAIAKHFRNPIPISLAAAVLIIYASTLALGAMKAVYMTEKLLDDPKGSQKVRVIMDEKAPVNANSLVFLSANSSYYFFVDRTSRAGVVLPKDLVKAVIHSNAQIDH